MKEKIFHIDIDVSWRFVLVVVILCQGAVVVAFFSH